MYRWSIRTFLILKPQFYTITRLIAYASQLPALYLSHFWPNKWMGHCPSCAIIVEKPAAKCHSTLSAFFVFHKKWWNILELHWTRLAYIALTFLSPYAAAYIDWLSVFFDHNCWSCKPVDPPYDSGGTFAAKFTCLFSYLPYKQKRKKIISIFI